MEARAAQVARRLLDGGVDRLEARAHPDMADDAVQQFGAEVCVTLHDGRVLSRGVDDQVGRGGSNPMSGNEMWEEFYDYARRVLSKPDIMPLFERLETLEKMADIGDVMRLLATRPAPGVAPARPIASAPVGGGREHAIGDILGSLTREPARLPSRVCSG